MRKSTYTGKYVLKKHEYLQAKWYALGYDAYIDEYNALSNDLRGIDYSKDRIQTSLTGSSTEDFAMRRAALKQKIENIEQSAIEADPDLYQYLILGVTQEGITYNALRMLKGLSCGQNEYYSIRRKFYYLLAKKI